MKLKNIVVGMVLTMMCATTMAQVGELVNHGQGKAVAKSYEPQFIGSDGQRVVLIEKAGRMRDKLELVGYDMEQNELVRVKMVDDKELNCYGGYMNQGGIDLLMAQWEGNDMKVYRDRRNPTTLQPVGEPLVLADYKGNEGDKMGFTLSASPNKELLAGLYIIQREGQRTELQVGLYSRELEEYWKMDSRCRDLDFVYVTDSGEVVLGGHANHKVTFYVIDGENEAEYSFDEDVIRFGSEMGVARYAGGKFYMVATHPAPGKNEIQPWVDYVACFCYDTKRRMLSVDKHMIDKVEYNRLYNLKDDNKVRKDDFRVMYMNYVQTMAEKDGCYAMFDQTWRVTVDGVPSTLNRLGMMVLHINNDGQFDWAKTFRISNVSNWAARTLSGYRWVRTEKGPLLVWAESKVKGETPEDKPVKDYRPANSAGMLTALQMDREGKMTRQHFDMPSKQSLMGAPHWMENGNLLLFVRGTSRGYFAEMSLK